MFNHDLFIFGWGWISRGADMSCGAGTKTARWNIFEWLLCRCAPGQRQNYLLCLVPIWAAKIAHSSRALPTACSNSFYPLALTSYYRFINQRAAWK